MKNRYIVNIIISIVVAIVTSLITISIMSKKYNKSIINYYSNPVKGKQVSYQNSDYNIGNESFSKIVKKIQPSTVFIQSKTINNFGVAKLETGTGIILTPDGYIVTNAHVINDSEEITVRNYIGQEYKGEIVGIDNYSDIAVIKVNMENSQFIFIQNSNTIEVGDLTLVFGNPMNLQNSVSHGIISAKNRNLNILGSEGIESFIQTDALATSGNSGGPLININGEMIGMVTAINIDEKESKSFTFAIPSNIVRKIAFDLINYHTVNRAWMGLNVRNNEINKGIVIERVIPDSPASLAELQTGDLIYQVDTIEIENVPQFQAIIAEKSPGESIYMLISRDNKTLNKKIVLKNHLNTDEFISIRKDKILLDYGFELRDLTTKEMVEYNTNGVLVTSVIKNSLVDNSNIEPGYIIEKINGMKISNVEKILEVLNSNPTTLEIIGIYKNYPGKFPYIIQNKR
ncbi:MAG: trypsin-like peptidase domain-containing protein [Saprospiraceae bacterium]